MKIDLGGPHGNAFALMAITYDVARAYGMSETSAIDITVAMRAGSYIDLLNVMEEKFPQFFEFLHDPRSRREMGRDRTRSAA